MWGYHLGKDLFLVRTLGKCGEDCLNRDLLASEYVQQ
jgi:hypothetical protein